ncbi:MAG: hypothetical protein AAFS07_16070 [Pseudomonadota bacterium]
MKIGYRWVLIPFIAGFSIYAFLLLGALQDRDSLDPDNMSTMAHFPTAKHLSLLGGALFFSLFFFLFHRHRALWMTPAAAPQAPLPWFFMLATVLSCAVVILYSPNAPLVPTWIATPFPLNVPLIDQFHEGEYLGLHAVIAGDHPLPRMIHGPGRNALPAAIAVWFGAPDHQIVTMRLVMLTVGILSLIAVAIVTYLATLAVLRGGPFEGRRHALAGMAAGLALTIVCYVGGSFDGRFFFLVMLGCCVQALAAVDDRRLGVRTHGGNFAAALAGVCLAIAPLHNYSAAVEAAALLFGMLFLSLSFSPSLGARHVLAVLLGLCGAVVVVLAAGGGPLYARSLSDIAYWVQNASAIWGFPITIPVRIAVLFATGLLAGLAGAAGLFVFWRYWSGDRPSYLGVAVICLLAGATLIATRNSMVVPDVFHFSVVLNTVAIPLSIVVTAVLAQRRGSSAVVLRWGWPACMVIVALTMAGDDRKSLLHIPAMMATPDEAVLTADLKAFKEDFADALLDETCLWALTNEGSLYFATGLPPCGEPLLPIYHSTAQGDAGFVDMVERVRPGVVVYESAVTPWAVVVFNPAARFPRALDKLGEQIVDVRQSGGRTVWLLDTPSASEVSGATGAPGVAMGSELPPRSR